MKKCNMCELEKDLSEFGMVKAKVNNYISKYTNICKKCACERSKAYGQKPENKEKRRKYNKKYKQENKEYILQYNQKWALNNPEKYKNTKRKLYEKYRESDEYKSYRSEYHKSYRLENKDKLQKYLNDYVSNRIKIDVIFLLRNYYKSMISHCFRSRGIYTKSTKTSKIIGCSFEELKLHIESKFETWMNWENKGLYNGELNYGWDIDHIVPLSSGKTEEEIIKLNHYTNLQPLCSYMNRVIKRDNY